MPARICGGMSQPSDYMAAIEEAVSGRETEVLDKLGIRWRNGRPHIHCPYLAHVDKHASWRWDQKKHRAFCTCASGVSIFDVVRRVAGVDFIWAADLIARLLGRTDLIRGSNGKDKADYTDPGGTPSGCRLTD